MKFLVLIFLLAAILDVSSAAFCPPFAPIINYSDDIQVAEVEGNLVARLWRQARPCLSANSRRLRNIIMHLGKSSFQQWRDVAFTITVWFWNQASQFGNEPNLCAFAKLANATLAWNTTASCDTLNPAIAKIVDIFVEGYSDTSIVILASNCSLTAAEANIRNPPRTENVVADDNNYVGKEIWCRFGSEYPCEFQQATMKAMCSHNYVDRLLALFATLSITKPFISTVDAFSTPSILPRYWPMITTVRDLDCCPDFRASLAAANLPSKDSILQSIKSQLGC